MSVIKITSLALVSPLYSPKNDLNGPKESTVVLTITIEYGLGSFGSHFGAIWGKF